MRYIIMYYEILQTLIKLNVLSPVTVSVFSSLLNLTKKFQWVRRE